MSVNTLHKRNEDDDDDDNNNIFTNCNWVVTRWQWLFYIYTEYEIGY